MSLQDKPKRLWAVLIFTVGLGLWTLAGWAVFSQYRVVVVALGAVACLSNVYWNFSSEFGPLTRWAKPAMFMLLFILASVLTVLMGITAATAWRSLPPGHSTINTLGYMIVILMWVGVVAFPFTMGLFFRAFRIRGLLQPDPRRSTGTVTSPAGAKELNPESNGQVRSIHPPVASQEQLVKNQLFIDSVKALAEQAYSKNGTGYGYSYSMRSCFNSLTEQQVVKALIAQDEITGQLKQCIQDDFDRLIGEASDLKSLTDSLTAGTLAGHMADACRGVSSVVRHCETLAHQVFAFENGMRGRGAFIAVAPPDIPSETLADYLELQRLVKTLRSHTEGAYKSVILRDEQMRPFPWTVLHRSAGFPGS